MCFVCMQATGAVEKTAEISGNVGAGSSTADSYINGGSEQAAETATMGVSGLGAGTLATLLLAWVALTVGLAKGTQILNRMH